MEMLGYTYDSLIGISEGNSLGINGKRKFKTVCRLNKIIQIIFCGIFFYAITSQII
jgi:hypothetical protein